MEKQSNTPHHSRFFMTSSFTWLDYSEQDRRKMLDVISLFREQTTRDELGIGAIRDAFANLFFPGVSTIQTRARYFLFIPWIYQDLINRKTTTQQVDSKLRASKKLPSSTSWPRAPITRAPSAKYPGLPSNAYPAAPTGMAWAVGVSIAMGVLSKSITSPLTG
jgi:hypothetical protein